MSIGSIFTLYAVNTPSGLIDQITEQSYDPRLNEILNSGDGKVDAEFAALMSSSPMVSFTTHAVATALGYAGISGLNISSAATLFFQRYAQGGTRQGATSHLKLDMALGLLVPRTLQVSHDGEASIGYDLFARSSDGTTNPITVTDAQSLSGSPAVDEKFTLGAVTVNNVALGAVQDVSIDFGIEEVVLGADGNPFPTFTGIRARRPSITIRTMHLDKLDADAGDITKEGIAISSSTTIVLARMAQGAIRGGTDITITVNEGRVSPRQASAGQDEATLELVITPTFDGTNDILAITGV